LDNNFFQTRGNHKSVIHHATTICNLLTEDVNQGYPLILPKSAIEKLPNLTISPIGCQEQDTINEHTNIVTKYCLTHDQSFSGPSGNSTNLHVIEDELPPCCCGHCLNRLINYIASVRLRHPTTPIYLSKYDSDSTFCRRHVSPGSALESCCIFNYFLFVSLSLTFGGMPCPNLWETFGQPTCDMANELIQNSQWDHSKRFDPLSLQILVPKCLPSNILFIKSLPLAADIPVNDHGKGDINVDDSIVVCPDVHVNIEQVAKAVPLAINSIAWPLSNSKQNPCRSLF
jgi:hypothetical protein